MQMPTLRENPLNIQMLVDFQTTALHASLLNKPLFIASNTNPSWTEEVNL